MSGLLPFVLDVVIAVLLVATIIYAYILDKRLKAIRNGRAELEALSAQFIQATENAQISIENLKKLSAESAEGLDKRVTGAQNLVDELKFLVQRGDTLAEQLSDGISSTRKDSSKDDSKGGKKPAKKSSAKSGKTSARQKKMAEDGPSASLSEALKKLDEKSDEWTADQENLKGMR